MKSIWVPVSGAIAQQRKVDTLANNIANANSPGFKKDDVVFKEYMTQLEKGTNDIDLPSKEWAPRDFYKTGGAQHAYVDTVGSYTSFSQGQLTPTNSPFDLAINGKGFFEVLSSNGVRYTRNGKFTIDKNGFLVTNDGMFVLKKLPGNNIESIPEGTTPESRRILLPNFKKMDITNNGKIVLDGLEADQLSVVEFADPVALKKEGNSLFFNTDNNNLLLDPKKSTVMQGFIEQSNVNVVNEMQELIKAHRHFEAIQKAISTYDKLMGRGLNEISKF